MKLNAFHLFCGIAAAAFAVDAALNGEWTWLTFALGMVGFNAYYAYKERE